MKKRLGYLFIIIVTIFFCGSSLYAEHLAVKNFSISEGLARNQVSTIFQDSRGFIWFGTADGLSRYNGYEFTNYNVQHGLPHPFISGIVEHESGIFWIATHGGLALVDFNQPLDVYGKLSVKNISLEDSVNATTFSIYLDPQKNLWAGTRNGLYKIQREDNEFRSRRISLGESYLPRREGIGNFISDHQGNLWIVTPDGLFRIDSAGSVKRYELGFGQYFDRLGNIAVDEAGRLWIGGLDGLYVLNPPPEDEPLRQLNQTGTKILLPENAGEYTVFNEQNGLPNKRVLEIYRSSDNRMWIATRSGIAVFNGEVFQQLNSKNGLISEDILCFGEDAAKNLWIGTEATGAMRVAANGFTSYSTADGLPDNRISSVFEGSDGEIYAVDANRNISRFNNGRFHSVTPNFPENFSESGWSWQRPVILDRAGEWWIATSAGLLRFPKVAHFEELAVSAPRAVYNHANDLPGNQVFRLYEARNGDVWISNFAPPASGITRFQRETQKLQKFNTDFSSFPEPVSAYSYAEDEHGNLWLGLTNGRLARYRNEELQLIDNPNELPVTNIYDIFTDRHGNLWLATGSGAFYLENPETENPRISSLTIEDGLKTNDIIAISDDLQGRIYFATSQGVQRYEPQTKRIELFTTSDGIASSELRTAMRSRNGDLWFGTLRGLTRFEPEKLKEIREPSPIYISSVRSGGKFFPVSEFGSEMLSGVELSTSQNHIEIEVLGLTQQSGDALKYQYKINRSDWSAPTTERKFTLVNLQPGEYEFEARVINSAGIVSENSALVSFTALAPFYRQWWFVPALCAVACAIVYLFYRSRLKRLVELENVRRHIASDLHDDIGASLSQISLISEVLALKDGSVREDKESLKSIAEISREAVGAMSEMIWAINPKSDNLLDTIQKMRRFTSEILTAADIQFAFKTTEFDKKIKINVNVRRQVYLIYKEIINNIAKHSEATEVSVEISRTGNYLTVAVADNGKGFDKQNVQPGNGLANIGYRAEKIGGALKINSKTGDGTYIELRVPNASGIFGRFST